MGSLWQETVKLPRFLPLQGDASTDVLIIGGGMAGLLCTYLLRQAGVQCIMVEARTIGYGVTSGTTAKVTAQHGLLYNKLAHDAGDKQAAAWLHASLHAVAQYRSLCATLGCGYEVVDSYVYSREDYRGLAQEAETLRRLGVQASMEERTHLPFPVKGAVRMPEQGQFHPLEFAAALAQGLPIHEHTAVRELTPLGAVTAHGTIRARHIVVATHFPFLNKHGAFFLKMHQSRSYTLALEGAPQLQGIYVDAEEKGLSLRNYGNLLLLCGGDHRTGKTGGGWEELQQHARKWFPGAQEAYRWATQDCMTLDGLPYVGRYSRNTPELYVATGFNKWGMSSSMVAATLLRDLLTGTQNDCTALLNPSRSMWKPQLAANALAATAGLLTPTTRRCPHMGCALHHNAVEHSWDCSCHGSRFDEDGKLLDGPATGDLGHKP